MYAPPTRARKPSLYTTPLANHSEICHTPNKSDARKKPIRESLGYSSRYKPRQYNSSTEPFNKTTRTNKMPVDKVNCATLGRKETKNRPNTGMKAAKEIHLTYFPLCWPFHISLK